jgi:rare lipoprotein A (peptidoglycan hydrolase)
MRQLSKSLVLIVLNAAVIISFLGCTASPKFRRGTVERPTSKGPTADYGYQTGMASYYGSEFHGRSTSSGETFDMHALTAAHQTLPLGTIIRVTHLGNHKSVVVKVNDRGPFVGDRILDLSYGAARQLGMIQEGVARVRIDILQLGEDNGQ